VNAAFDAMSDWRTEAAESNDRHMTKVIDKMAAAARALGWPKEIVDANRGRTCGTLKAKGRDVGEILIAEKLAVPFVCGEYRCPRTPRPWC
jgi:hypothetical protein